jgi:hypothetical protein
MTTEKALSIARNLKHGPLPKDSDPTPDIDEAISIIEEERRTCGFNWITGTAAVETLELTKAQPTTKFVLDEIAKGK